MKTSVRLNSARSRLSRMQNLRLGGDVEAGGDLVGDDEFRLERDRPGDADALALAAGQLVRVAVAEGAGQADDLEKLAGALAPRGGRAEPAEGLERALAGSGRWSGAG